MTGVVNAMRKMDVVFFSLYKPNVVFALRLQIERVANINNKSCTHRLSHIRYTHARFYSLAAKT